MNIQDVEKLAMLSRIEMPPEEKEAIMKDLESIVGYIKQIENVSVEDIGEIQHEFINITREDVNPHESGLFTEKILNEVPEVENGFVKVQAIL